MTFLKLGFEVLIFLMTAVKAVEHARSQQINTPMLKSLYFDQFWYFLVSNHGSTIENYSPHSNLLVSVFIGYCRSVCQAIFLS